MGAGHWGTVSHLTSIEAGKDAVSGLFGRGSASIVIILCYRCSGVVKAAVLSLLLYRQPQITE